MLLPVVETKYVAPNPDAVDVSRTIMEIIILYMIPLPENHKFITSKSYKIVKMIIN
jgi:hypothetical protein